MKGEKVRLLFKGKKKKQKNKKQKNQKKKNNKKLPPKSKPKLLLGFQRTSTVIRSQPVM
jgi:hypothetical protein